MKVSFSRSSTGITRIDLTPETEGEAKHLQDLALDAGRSMQFRFRGYQYMHPTFEFFVSPTPVSD